MITFKLQRFCERAGRVRCVDVGARKQVFSVIFLVLSSLVSVKLKKVSRSETVEVAVKVVGSG